MVVARNLHHGSHNLHIGGPKAHINTRIFYPGSKDDARSFDRIHVYHALYHTSYTIIAIYHLWLLRFLGAPLHSKGYTILDHTILYHTRLSDIKKWELNLTYHISKTILFTIYPYYGYSNYVPYQSLIYHAIRYQGPSLGKEGASRSYGSSADG